MLVSGRVLAVVGDRAEIATSSSVVTITSGGLAVGDRVQLQLPPPSAATLARAFSSPSLQVTVLPGEVAEGMDPEFDVDDDVQPATAGDRESRPLFTTRS